MGENTVHLPRDVLDDVLTLFVCRLSERKASVGVEGSGLEGGAHVREAFHQGHLPKSKRDKRDAEKRRPSSWGSVPLWFQQGCVAAMGAGAAWVVGWVSGTVRQGSGTPVDSAPTRSRDRPAAMRWRAPSAGLAWPSDEDRYLPDDLTADAFSSPVRVFFLIFFSQIEMHVPLQYILVAQIRYTSGAGLLIGYEWRERRNHPHRPC